MKDAVQIDGITYRREGQHGNRAVVVVDRGWIFAGDVTEENGRIYPHAGRGGHTPCAGGEL